MANADLVFLYKDKILFFQTFDLAAELFPFVIQMASPVAQFGVGDVVQKLRVAFPVDRIPRLELGAFNVEIAVDKVNQGFLGRLVLGGVHQAVEVVQHR